MRSTRVIGRVSRSFAAVTTLLLIPGAANADLILSEVIVDFGPDKPAREDIEAWNNGTERIYIVAQPAEILAAGTSGERRVEAADPSQSGLLVTPRRMVLEPGERRLVRIAALSNRPEHDRIYRVTIKPVVGDVKAGASAIKFWLGTTCSSSCGRPSRRVRW